MRPHVASPDFKWQQPVNNVFSKAYDMNNEKIRNIAIIAHVDHGKTTLVDQLFKQSGMFRENQVVIERFMDSMDLERERGITITSKNGSFRFEDHVINIIDTPGHADFGGQVERVLKMADGALLLVDAQEGPMPQTYFVLKKALALRLPIIIVINKVDMPRIRPDWVVDQVFDLFVKLEAPDSILDFPILFTSAKQGYATRSLDDPRKSMAPLCQEIIQHVPPPSGDDGGPLQMLVSSIEFSPYLGRLGIGKITSGALAVNREIAVSLRDGKIVSSRVTKIYRFEGNQKSPVDTAGCGEIVAVAGVENVTVGVTLTDKDNPQPLPPVNLDPPTITMTFIPNDSPFTGQAGTFLTSRHLEERLERAALADVALIVEKEGAGKGFKVSGRGELHLSILIERMRREGYEFQVTRPHVIFLKRHGRLLEPYENLTIDVDEEYVGCIIEGLGKRKGKLQNMDPGPLYTRLMFTVPARCLLGYRSVFLSDTRGMGTMSYVFHEYGPFAGDIRQRKNGVLVALSNCNTVAFALFNLQDRGRLFVGPGEPVYAGQIIGEHCRENDLRVNPAKGKKLTNMRAAGSDENVILIPPVEMGIEDCLAFINDDELVEVTPAALRLRKRPLAKQ